MLDYIIKVLLFQTLFLAVYDMLLKRETFFQWNRLYLIFTSIFTYVIPLIKIESVQKIIPQEYIVFLPEVVLTPTAVIKQQFDWSALFFTSLQVVFLMGVILTSLLFFVKLYKIIRLISENEKELTANYYLVWMNNNTAFSFFNYIFLGKESTNKNQIIEHELVHVNQKHSLDLLFFEVQKIVGWFNPLSYLYQQRISELHEFIADSKVVKEKNKASYFNDLLAETFGVNHISFINPFLKHSLLKKRIMMVNKSKSKQFKKVKFLLLIPVLASMLIYTSCERAESEIQPENNIAELEKSTFEGLSKNEIKGLLTFISEEMEKSNSKEKAKVLERLYVRLLGIRENLELGNVYNKKSTEFTDEMINEGLSFSIINQSPIFPGCEDASDPKKCFQENIQKFVGRNFNPRLAKNLDLESGKKRVIVLFKIDKNGMITGVRARGPHKSLEEEAIRVVKSLPKMKAGEYDGKKVAVKYTLPITFQVD